MTSSEAGFRLKIFLIDLGAPQNGDWLTFSRISDRCWLGIELNMDYVNANPDPEWK